MAKIENDEKELSFFDIFNMKFNSEDKLVEASKSINMPMFRKLNRKEKRLRDKKEGKFKRKK